MIIALVTAVHLLVCFILIVSVLLQSGKGADLAGAFGGGGSQTAFGSRGPATFLSRLTTFAAITFMVTSLTLAVSYNLGPESAITAEDPAPAAATPASNQPASPSSPSRDAVNPAAQQQSAQPSAGDEKSSDKPDQNPPEKNSKP